MADDHLAAETFLRRIADILGVPISELYQNSEPQQLRAAGECVCLWYKIKTDFGRDAALKALRKVVDDEASR